MRSLMVLLLAAVAAVAAVAQQHVTITLDPAQQPGTASGYLVNDGVQVSLTPLQPTIASGGAVQFTATVKFAQNTGVSWTTSVGTIDSTGLFIAPQVTSDTPVTVVATSLAAPASTVSTVVTVKAVASVMVGVSPKTVTLLAGTAQQFTATVTGTTNTAVNWSAQGGTVTSSGNFTAGSGPAGTVTAASAQDATKADTATVTITPVQPPSGAFDGPAELPRAYVTTSLAATPAPGKVTPVAAGASLQTALNNAACGDTLALQAGATWAGTVTAPAKACDDGHWIIVRTAAPDASLPGEGSRMLPCYAGVTSLPGRPPFTCPSSNNVLAKLVGPGNNSGPILLANGANHYRFMALEITRSVGTGINYALVSALGTANKIILDRIWPHGTAQDETKTGIQLAGITNGAVIDSYVGDMHCTSVVGSCTDAKAIGGGVSTLPGGPYKIVNNFLEASGENILFGGGSATTTPADIEIRHNHFFKPLTWLAGQPGFVGGPGGQPFMVKNLLELKNAQRVLIEGNIFEYSWGGYSQAGYALLLTPKNQAGGCPICQVSDVTIRYSTFSHSGSGLSLANVADDGGQLATAGQRYSIHDITVDDVNMTKYAGTPGSSNGPGLQMLSVFVIPLNSIKIDHVTIFGDPKSKILSISNYSSTTPMFGLTLTNSIVGQALYPIWNAGGPVTACAASNVPLTTLNTCFPNGYTWSKVAAIAVNLQNYPTTKWPAGTLFPATATAVSFVNFNGGVGGNYQLLPSSPYYRAGTDGKDLGADITAINAATAGAY